MKKVWIYESPDKGKTVYRREFGSNERELYKETEKVVDLREYTYKRLNNENVD